MSRNIPLLIPDIQPEDIQAVTDVLQSGMLVQGKQVEAFEANVTAITGAHHAVAVSNGTATMHLAAYQTLSENDEVIVPAFSYVATANVVELINARPVFVDICLGDFNIDVSQIEAAITERTRAIIPVHEFGLAANMTAIMEIARKHNLIVIEDAACALGATHKGGHVGTFGDFGSFSFHPRKAITSGEGGCVVMRDPFYAEALQILRNHGYSNTAGDFTEPGFNYRMTDFQAALVNSQFPRFLAQVAHKRQLAEIYTGLLKDAVLCPGDLPDAPHTYQTYHVVLPDHLDRDDVIKQLKEKGIGSNYGAQCIPNTDYYRNEYGFDCAKQFPNALRANQQGLALPMYAKLNADDVSYIGQTLLQIIS